MGRLSDSRRNQVVDLAIGAIFLLIIALVEHPKGWLTAICLIPLVVTVTFLEDWYLAGASILALAASATFRSVPWFPPPTTVLFIISVLSLVQLQQLRGDPRRRKAQFREEREWRAFFDNSPAAMLTADEEGRIIMGNAAAQKLLGFEDEPLRGKGLASCLPALATALRIERAKPLSHTLTGCKSWRPNNEMFVADAWLSIDKTEFGTRLGAVIVDASERLQDRERWVLRSSMATSQIAMGAVLHELRNLSAAASVMLTNLERHTKLLKNADFVALGNLLKALAKIASAELRPGEGSHSSVDVRALLDQLRIIIGPSMQESEISVTWKLAADLPHVWGEEPGLLQIFLNLAQNSSKAMHSSEQKKLTISAAVEHESVVVRFQDTGPGVTHPDELFQPFHRASGAKGLGLYVSRAIAHSFSGELTYEPVPAGCCFAVELVPLREWQKVTGEYGSATAAYQNSSH
jgi:two-component system, LuxR family, sensor kinase FixL